MICLQSLTSRTGGETAEHHRPRLSLGGLARLADGGDHLAAVQTQPEDGAGAGGGGGAGGEEAGGGDLPDTPLTHHLATDLAHQTSSEYRELGLQTGQTELPSDHVPLGGALVREGFNVRLHMSSPDVTNLLQAEVLNGWTGRVRQ